MLPKLSNFIAKTDQVLIRFRAPKGTLPHYKYDI